MRSVQERELSGDATSESGFFQRGQILGRGMPEDCPLPSEALQPDHFAASAAPASAGGVPASHVVQETHVADAVLQAFGEVRSLNAELQQANDALHLVNETLRGKVEQLRTTALDLEQMVDGVELGILLLDEELVVRHFNAMASHFLGIGAHDVGGSVSASCRGFGPRLVEWCREVLRSGRRIRRTFQSAIGEPLTLHVRRTLVDGEARLILVFMEAV